MVSIIPVESRKRLLPMGSFSLVNSTRRLNASRRHPTLWSCIPMQRSLIENQIMCQFVPDQDYNKFILRLLETTKFVSSIR